MINYGMEFTKKRKADKSELKKIETLIKKIKQEQEKMKESNYFKLILSTYGKEMLTQTAKRSIEEKNSFYIEYAYQLLTSWDNHSDMPKEIGRKLEKLIDNKNLEIGIHRTSGYGIITPDNIYNSPELYDMFNNGLHITGDINIGVKSLSDVIQPNKNISPIINIIDAIILSKSSYKQSKGGIITAIPSQYVTADYELKPGQEKVIYKKEDDLCILKPEYLVGFIAQNNGIYTFYSREEIINNYKAENKKTVK